MVLPQIGQAASERALRERISWQDRRPTVVAAVLAAGAVAILIAAFGSVSPFERPVVLESLTDSVHWICEAIIGACGTIAALMLATVSLLERLETRRMQPRILFHLRLTTVSSIVAIAFAVAAMLLTTFPIAGGVDVHPPPWQIDAVYFAMLILTALMIGAFAVVLTSLYATIADVLGGLPQDWVEEILEEDEEIREDATDTSRDEERAGKT
jgi:MFS family permease